jgi:carboxypeptidase T
MKRFIVLFLILFCLQLEYAFSSFHLVRIFLNNEQDLIKLEKLSLDFESATKGKDFVDLVVNDYELTTLASSGLNFSVLFDDYEKYLSEQIQQENRKEPVEPLSFKLGSMGGFYKLNEIYERFDELAKNYPYFIQADTIGSSWEGRKIVAYAFGSNNTKSDEVLITALHHSREPATVTTIIYFLNTIFDLAKEGNPEAEYLLQNRRIWVIPVLNPDGYFYNETRYPNGGGMWRKNRRPINSTDTGVDLNRNYGPYEFWNANNNGSSTNPKNETYRGPEPFSEPELQALRSFCFQHKFEMALNFHTYGGMLIYPYSALSSETPDSVWYRSFGMYIQPLTSYYFGTDLQTVGYATRGSSDDWFYTPDSTKGKVLAFSPEASYQFDGFWPKQNRIIQIAKENFPLILNFLWSAGAN